MSDSPVLPLHFYVEGDPAPQGSKSIGAHGQMYEKSKRVGPWREAVAEAAMVAMSKARWKMTEDDVAVIVVFDVTRRDDLDKLIRATGDALTAAGVFGDDRQIVEWHARRRKPTQTRTLDGKPKTGADIIVSRREA